MLITTIHLCLSQLVMSYIVIHSQATLPSKLIIIIEALICTLSDSHSPGMLYNASTCFTTIKASFPIIGFTSHLHEL